MAICAGFNHALALLRSGQVIAWGDNSYHQCDVPPIPEGAIAISASYAHSLALKADGRVRSWGANGYFDGSINRETPPDLSNVVAIAAGWSNSVALKNDGHLVVWGENVQGISNVTNLTKIVSIATFNFKTVILALNDSPTALDLNLPGFLGEDMVVQLVAADKDADRISFSISTLPSGGQLYRYSGGTRGTQITAAGTLVTDPGGQVVFLPAFIPAGTQGPAFKYAASDVYATSKPATVLVVRFKPHLPILCLLSTAATPMPC